MPDLSTNTKQPLSLIYLDANATTQQLWQRWKRSLEILVVVM